MFFTFVFGAFLGVSIPYVVYEFANIKFSNSDLLMLSLGWGLILATTVFFKTIHKLGGTRNAR